MQKMRDAKIKAGANRAVRTQKKQKRDSTASPKAEAARQNNWVGSVAPGRVAFASIASMNLKRWSNESATAWDALKRKPI